MPQDNASPRPPDSGSTLRPFLLAALLVVTGLTLMGWDERNEGDGAKPL